MTRETITTGGWHQQRPYIFTALTVTAILLLTLLPMPETGVEDELFPHFDKVVHFLMFGVLATVWWRERTLRRGCPKSRLQDYAVVVIWTILTGGGDELLQWILGYRGGDAMDLLADSAGALVVPIACRALVDYKLPHNALRLVALRRPGEGMAEMERVYMSSFPVEERRAWEQIVDFSSRLRHPLTFTLITIAGRPVGFLTWWRFKGFRYVEHFAVEESMRGRGIGELALGVFVERDRSPVVLEVEPAERGALARRRIRFYERCGFRPHPDYRYVQPPYAEGLPEVALMLMTASYRSGSVNLAKIDRVLKMMVYGCKK